VNFMTERQAPGRQAELLNDTQVRACLRWCDERRRYPHRDRVVVLLSVRAGLRAVEIARLRRGHVMDGGGGIADVIDLQDRLSKKGPGRVIPMHADLRTHIIKLFGIVPGGPDDPLILSERAMRPNPEDPADGRLVCMAPNSIVLMFGQMYGELGLAGCSSHSGRRTFITKVAGKITEAGGSLRDVQQLAGHTSLNTTQRYVDGSDEAKRRVMKLL
jgi:integrase